MARRILRGLLLLLKLAGGILGGTVLLVALGIAAVLVRKSGWFILRSDLHDLVVDALHDPSRASQLCGTHADLVMSPRLPDPGAWPPFRDPEVSLGTWWPVLPMSGTVEARVSGVGGVHSEPGGGGDVISRASEQPCAGSIRFDYRFEWQDNGVSVGLDGEVVGNPVIRSP